LKKVQLAGEKQNSGRHNTVLREAENAVLVGLDQKNGQLFSCPMFLFGTPIGDFRSSPAKLFGRKSAGKGQGQRSCPKDSALMLPGASGIQAGAMDGRKNYASWSLSGKRGRLSLALASALVGLPRRLGGACIAVW
jgi:hypothetical protein